MLSRLRFPARLSTVCLVVTALGRLAGMATAGDEIASEKPSQSPAWQAFFNASCLDCHQGPDGEAGLDLSALSMDLSNPAVERRWVQIIDRVSAGEMPPKDADPPPAKAKASFVRETSQWVRTFQVDRDRRLGRVRARRLTRREVERSLHDLLGIDIPLANQMPEEPRTSGFTTVANGQAMSHFQLERHLAVVDIALEEAFDRALSPPDRYERDFDAEGVARENPKRRTREPELLNGQAVVWSSGLIYYGRIPATAAPEDGWYRFKVRVSGLKLPRTGGVWTTVNTGLCVSSAPLLTYVTAFEALDEPRDIEFEAWLPRRHMLEIRPGDTTLKKARFDGGQVGVGEGEPQNVPGIAIDRITMERFHQGPDNEGIRQLLFGDIPVVKGERDRLRPRPKDPKSDAADALATFARRAFRRPVSKVDLGRYVELVHAALDAEQDFASALRLGYRAILCSPRFLYLTEEPGPLDDYAIAARVSYMLTGSTPDATLTKLAAAERLHDRRVVRAQVDRLLDGEGGRRFIADFAGEWLDLDLIDFTQPDRRMYPDFDAIVQNSMLAETHTFLETMLRENRSVRHLVDADFTYLNSRLARFYELSDDVRGDDLQRVSLEPESHRGGLLTQGAILKVTANGSNTSPVIRGVWICDRLLGEQIPPPPADTPAIEPDIRGATTIREQLDKHRSDASCARCHVKIDPPGFALENFDPAGQWRERYTRLEGRDRKKGPPIDPSHTLPDGREFDGIDQFRRLVAEDARQLAENVAEKLLTYGSGVPISFADRAAIEEIVASTADDDYGFKSLIEAVVTHPVFLSK